MAISLGKLHGSPRPEENADALDGLDTEEREAFNDFYREFVPRVAGYVRRHIHDHELIDEIVQEALLRAYRHGLHLEEGDEHWRWLATVARNLCIDQRALHRNWRESSVEEPETLDLTVYDFDPETHVVAAERQEIVARALEQLTERERRLLVQKHIEGRRVREMANHEGVHVEALKSALRRARKAFAESYAAVTDRTGVASVFGPLVAGASLRLRELKARIGAMGDQVTTLAAHVTTSSGFLNTATTAAVIVGLALGPGLDTLVPSGPGSDDTDGASPRELVLGSGERVAAPDLATAVRDWESAAGRAGARAGADVRGGGGRFGSGSGDGETSSPGGEPTDDLGSEVPGGADIGTSSPQPEPVDLGEDEVEDPDDAEFKDFAYASGSQGLNTADDGGDGDDSGSTDGSGSTSGDGTSDASEEGDSADSSEQGGSTEDPGDSSATSQDSSSDDSDSDASDAPGDSMSGEPDGDSSDDADASEGTTDDSAGSNQDSNDANSTDDGSETDAEETDEPEETDSADGESVPDAEARDEEGSDEEAPAEESDESSEVGFPDVFALGEPLPEKRGDCEIQCSVLFRSTDGGASWEKLPATGLEADHIVVAPDYPDDPRLFAVGRMGLMVSDDSGHSFWPVATGTSMGMHVPHKAPSIEFWPGFGEGEDRVVIGANHGAWVYHADTGAVRPLVTGLVLVREITAVSRPDRPDGVIVAGIGSTWKRGQTAPRPARVAVFCTVVCEPWGDLPGRGTLEVMQGREGARLVIAGGGNVYTSDVHRETWEPLDAALKVSRIVVSSDGTMYASSAGYEQLNDGSHQAYTLLYASYDGGERWASLHRVAALIGKFVVFSGGRLIGAPSGGGVVALEASTHR